MAYIMFMIFSLIETHTFTNEIKRLMNDEEYRALQWSIAIHPETGDLIPGSGGLRKLRWRISGKGKRGGLRIIYYIKPPSKIYLLFPYKKSETKDLTKKQIAVLRNHIKENLQ